MGEVATVLTQAVELLQRTSWDPTCIARDGDGNRIEPVWAAKSYSLIGAITHVCHDDKLIAQIVVSVLGSDGLTAPMQLTHWEKAPGRTLEEVLALVDQALAKDRHG